MRADALRNRERLLAAGSEVFAERGLAASLEEVARRAGVSIGTLYNHFPSREALLDALVPERITALDRAAERALAHEDPWAGFVIYLEAIFELQSQDRALGDALTRAYPNATELTEACRRGFGPAERIVARARRAGRLREDFGVQDIPALVWAIAGVVDATGRVAPGAWRRTMYFLLDGLRADAAHHVRVPPLTVDEVEAAMRDLAERSTR